MCRKYILATVILLACFMLSSCQRQDGLQTTNDSSLPSTESVKIPDDSEDSHPPISFSSYQEYIAFLQEYTPQTRTTKDGDFISDTMRTYVQEIRNKPESWMVPYHGEDPVILRDIEGLSAITIFDEELYHFPWTWFFMNLDGERVIITLSELSEENCALAREMSCSEFIAAIAPSAPNVDNYQQKENYQLVFEEDAVIDGRNTSLLIKQAKDGTEYITFVFDRYLVEISSPTGTVTEEWLRDFSLAPFSN